jgi:hypothetical protein
MEEISRAAARARRRRWVVAAVVAPAAVLASLGAAKAIEARKAQHPEQVGCYATASLDADTAIIRIDPRAQSPTEACARLWRSGAVQPDAETTPRLVACASPKQGVVVGVFPMPSPDGCQRLGLADLLDSDGRPVPVRDADPAQPGEAERRATAKGLREAIDARVGAATCVPVAKVEPIVRDELRGRGLRGWKVLVDPKLRQPIRSRRVLNRWSTPPFWEVHTGPCTNMDVDTRHRVVSLSALTDISYPQGGGAAPSSTPSPSP